MSGKKSFAGLCLATALWVASFAHAENVPRTVEARLALFAQCAGRFSARMEHDWLLGDSGEAAAEGRRQMVDLIAAIGPQPGLGGRELLALRIDSKMAHAALLTRATFGKEPQALVLARRYLARCEALLPMPLDLAALH